MENEFSLDLFRSYEIFERRKRTDKYYVTRLWRQLALVVNESYDVHSTFGNDDHFLRITTTVWASEQSVDNLRAR